MSEIEQKGSENESHEERLKIREDISSLSFEELLKMKEEMGSKLYNEKLFGKPKKIRKENIKRVNKNRPREISSKLKPKRVNRVLNPQHTFADKRVLPRDPRFDPLCGEYDSKSFKDNYRFVNDIRQEEKKQLEVELKQCTNVDRKNTLKYLIQRMDNQFREERKNEMEAKKKYEEKVEVRDKLKKGEMPVLYKKKSVKKLEDLIEKFEHLKKTNRLRKHIEKKSKKLSSKDRKKLMNQQL